jgi:hypothetical protein
VECRGRLLRGPHPVVNHVDAVKVSLKLLDVDLRDFVFVLEFAAVTVTAHVFEDVDDLESLVLEVLEFFDDGFLTL